MDLETLSFLPINPHHAHHTSATTLVRCTLCAGKNQRGLTHIILNATDTFRWR